MIGCHDLWWRSPGSGVSPFAGDGPWRLMLSEQGDMAGEVSTTVLDTGSRLIDVIKIDTSRRPRTALDGSEVAERDRVTAWLELLAEPLDRVIVHRATLSLWRGEPRPPWKEIKRAILWPKGLDALAFAYRRSLALIVCHLNGWPARRARALAASERRYEPWQGEPIAS